MFKINCYCFKSQRLYPVSMIHMTQTFKSVSSSLDLTPRRCLHVCLQAWEDHFHVSGASHPQHWSSSLMPLALSNPHWGAGVTFFPLLNCSTFIIKQYVASSFTLKLSIICHLDYHVSQLGRRASLPLPTPYRHQGLLSKTCTYLRICAYRTRELRRWDENFIISTLPQNDLLKQTRIPYQWYLAPFHWKCLF